MITERGSETVMVSVGHVTERVYVAMVAPAHGCGQCRADQESVGLLRVMVAVMTAPLNKKRESYLKSCAI